MATGRGMSRSIVGSSDVIYDFTCTPCTEDEKNTEAFNYCENCDTYFCKHCVVHHNKVFKSHKLLDKVAMVTAAKQTKQDKSGTPLPTKECGEHRGNIVQMYCGTHDVCCCTVCIALEHRDCKNVNFIPKIARGIFKGKERQTTRSSLETIQGEMKQLKSEKEKELSELEESKQDILDEIQKFKEQIIARVNELDRKSREEVCERYCSLTDIVKTDLASLCDLLQCIESDIESLEQIQSSESEFFVAVKECQNLTSKCKSLLLSVNTKSTKHISYGKNVEIETFLKDVDTFGTVIVTDYDDHIYSANLIGEYDVKVTADKETCRIFDLCVLDDYQYIITDLTNSKIKRLDKTFSVTDWCKVQKPWGVCNTGINEIAVTLCNDHKVMIFDCDKTLRSKHTFGVGLYCRGIAYNDGRLYIGCNDDTAITNEIKVYDLTGSHLCTFTKDSDGNDMFSSIRHISLNVHDSFLYVVDRDKGLIILDTTGKIILVVSHKNLDDMFGVCSTDQGQVFLCDISTGSVFQKNRNDDSLHEILTQTDGIQKPLSVTFVPHLKHLVVTCKDTDKIKVFQLT